MQANAPASQPPIGVPELSRIQPDQIFGSAVTMRVCFHEAAEDHKQQQQQQLRSRQGPLDGVRLQVLFQVGLAEAVSEVEATKPIAVCSLYWPTQA